LVGRIKVVGSPAFFIMKVVGKILVVGHVKVVDNDQVIIQTVFRLLFSLVFFSFLSFQFVLIMISQLMILHEIQNHRKSVVVKKVIDPSF
jgi:uncharacterized membrane protein